jgi:hypothetical protein
MRRGNASHATRFCHGLCFFVYVFSMPRRKNADCTAVTDVPLTSSEIARLDVLRDIVVRKLLSLHAATAAPRAVALTSTEPTPNAALALLSGTVLATSTKPLPILASRASAPASTEPTAKKKAAKKTAGECTR